MQKFQQSLQCCISRSCSADSILILVTVSTNVTSSSIRSWILCGKLPITIIFNFASLSEQLGPKCKVWLLGQINITDGLIPVCALHVGCSPFLQSIWGKISLCVHVGWNQYVLYVGWDQLVNCMMGQIMANRTTKLLSGTLKNNRFGMWVCISELITFRTIFRFNVTEAYYNFVYIRNNRRWN